MRSLTMSQQIHKNDNTLRVSDQIINKELNSKIIKMGYVWLLYSGIVTLIILIMPEYLMHTSPIINLVNLTGNMMPYILYLSTQSQSPYVVLYAYGVVLVSAPIHAAFSIATVIISHMAGYNEYKKSKKKALLVSWFPLLMVWCVFFSCFGCHSPQDWYDSFAISNRLIMALLGQSLFIGASIAFGIYILAISIKLKLIQE